MRNTSMNKQLGATMLVAGTCIGGGMIALPMVMSKIGIIPSFIVMALFGLIVYATAIVNLELHLQAGEPLTLAQLCRKFSGPTAESVGIICFKLLSYSLLIVYIYGSSSLLSSALDQKYSFSIIVAFCSVLFGILMLSPIKLVDYLNRILFLLMISIIVFLILGLLTDIQINNLPLMGPSYNKISAWELIIPVVFTSFGFQGSIPAIAKYCNNNQKLLKKVFFVGSLIPAIVYFLWTTSVLGVISSDQTFFTLVTQDKIEVGDMIKQLSHISKWPLIHELIWWISFLAIITSLIGVGIGLVDSNQSLTKKFVSNSKLNKLISVLITTIPAYVLSIVIPNAFIKVLGFAGMILVVIAIILPIYLLTKIDRKHFCIELENDNITSLIFITGIVIIVCELLNIL